MTKYLHPLEVGESIRGRLHLCKSVSYEYDDCDDCDVCHVYDYHDDYDCFRSFDLERFWF